MVYRYCMVPMCKSTTVTTPAKTFIKIPADPKIRKTWVRAARRDPKDGCTKTAFYLCEDHFNLEEDMENFMEWKMMGCKKKMKKDAVPHKFSCQTDERQTVDKLRKRQFTKRRKVEIIQDAITANDLRTKVIMENDHVGENTQGMQDIRNESVYFDEYDQRVADQPQENEDLFEEKPLICEDSTWVENARIPTDDLNVAPISPQRLLPSKRRLSETEEQCRVNELEIKEDYNPPYTAEDRFDVFGKTVAIKLRELPRGQMLIAEKLINEILFQAEMGNLTLSHKLVVEDPSLMNSRDLR